MTRSTSEIAARCLTTSGFLIRVLALSAVALPRGPFRLHRRAMPLAEQALERGRDLVAQHGDAAVAFRRDPVELDHAALARERLVAVPGIVGALEGQKRPGRGRNLHDRIVEAVGRFQQPQPPARMLPLRVHVDQNGDDLARRVGMDAPVSWAAVTADGDRVRSADKIEAELLLENLAEFVTRQFVEEISEMGAVRKLIDREAAALGDPRIVAVDVGARLRTDETGNDEILERLFRQRRRLQRVEIEITQHLDSHAPPRRNLFRAPAPVKTTKSRRVRTKAAQLSGEVS